MSGLPYFNAELFLAFDKFIISNFYGVYHEKFSRYFWLNLEASFWIFLQ